MKVFKPDYASIHEWEFYADAAETEYLQATEEGLDVAAYKPLFDFVYRMPQNEIKKQLGDVLFNIVQSAPTVENYPYTEPSTLPEIQALRVPFAVTSVNAVTRDKVYGAWMGRICGCLLGKTVEGIRTNELIPFLKETNNYPLHRYILRSDITDEIRHKYQFPFHERYCADDGMGMPPDDDTNYTVMYQKIVETYGKDFTSRDVAQSWPNLIRKHSYCTAERVAYCNIVKGFAPPDTAQFMNPYREWIGAQIRGDYFGYIHPGNPEKAAETAFRDACVSHTKNGIYGEMFVAAMIACAAVNDSIEDIIEGGLAQIPHTSRLYEAIKSVLADHRGGVSERECFTKLHDTYNEVWGHYWCHTIPNAIVVTAALLYGKGDYSRSVCIAVENGYDTDCNAATVGSILGMRGGIGVIDEKWRAPIGDTLHTTLFALPSVSITECVDMTMKHIEEK